MRRKINVIIVTLLICLTAIIIVPEDSEVEANPGGDGGDTVLDLQLIRSISENLSNVIYNAYTDDELCTGRAFGTKGEHYAANYIYDMTEQY